MHPALSTPKYIGSHSRQFMSRIATLSPRLSPRLSRKLAKRFAFSSNSAQVISLLNASSGLDSMSEYSRHVVLRFSSSCGLISTSATSLGHSRALRSSISVIASMSANRRLFPFRRSAGDGHHLAAILGALVGCGAEGQIVDRVLRGEGLPRLHTLRMALDERLVDVLYLAGLDL